MKMAALRLAVRPFLQSVREKTRVVFSPRYLLVTNTAICMGMSAVGDMIIQSYQVYNQQKKSWEWRRVVKVGGTGLLTGPLCHYWYIFLDWWLPGRAFRTVVKKIIVDQLVISPLFIGIYLTSLASLDDKSWAERRASIWEKGKSLFVADMAVWPPAQIVNFLFLPTRFRVLYDNTISFGFDCYFSYVQFPLEEEEESEGKEANKKDGCEKMDFPVADSVDRMGRENLTEAPHI